MRRPRAAALVVALAILAIPAIAFAGGDGDFSEYEAKGWGWMYLASFGFGFLTSLTPCVYPMIPITAAIVGGEAVGGSGTRPARLRPFLLTLTYVVGLALVYAGLGLFAGM